jgi:hypothetical protein
VIVGTTSMPKEISVVGTYITEEISYSIGGSDDTSFEVVPTSWNPTTGGVLSVTFLPSEERDYNATITFSSLEIEDIVVELSGAGVPPILINETDINDIKIYSYSNYVFIKNETKEPLKSIEIFDLMGRLIFQRDFTDLQIMLPLQVANGIYTVRLFSSDGKMITKQVPIIK